jgi:hypothetical protein
LVTVVGTNLLATNIILAESGPAGRRIPMLFISGSDDETLPCVD